MEENKSYPTLWKYEIQYENAYTFNDGDFNEIRL